MGCRHTSVCNSERRPPFGAGSQSRVKCQLSIGLAFIAAPDALQPMHERGLAPFRNSNSRLLGRLWSSNVPNQQETFNTVGNALLQSLLCSQLLSTRKKSRRCLKSLGFPYHDEIHVSIPHELLEAVYPFGPVTSKAFIVGIRVASLFSLFVFPSVGQLPFRALADVMQTHGASHMLPHTTTNEKRRMGRFNRSSTFRLFGHRAQGTAAGNSSS
ncbi:hypothetical protein V8C35DRAFT_152855 [Trichoderma chlorosporum]